MRRIFKWIFLLIIYALGPLLVSSVSIDTSPVYRGSVDFDLFSVLLGYILCFSPIGVIFTLSFLAYQKDKEREKSLTDTFWSNHLFFRFGQKMNDLTLSVPTSREWDLNDISRFARSLRIRLRTQLHNYFESNQNVSIKIIKFRDKYWGDEKTFLRITFHTERGSQLTHFVHYAITNASIVAHYNTYLRGTHDWMDVLDFVLESPFRIWKWYPSWLQNEFSIISELSRFIRSSFDEIDIMTYFYTSNQIILKETEIILEDQGLFTEEIKTLIVNNINNSQNITISESENIRLGETSNKVNLKHISGRTEERRD